MSQVNAMRCISSGELLKVLVIAFCLQPEYFYGNHGIQACLDVNFFLIAMLFFDYTNTSSYHRC